ncbi:MAG: hypothetical protein PHH86_07710, partial [Sphaerochaetaceae bacterium]|nr:hypothetical protein [Sphaerochaetaceae bacterium]
MVHNEWRPHILLLILLVVIGTPVSARIIDDDEPARYPLPVNSPVKPWFVPTTAQTPLSAQDPFLIPVISKEDEATRLLLLYYDIVHATEEENRRRANALSLEHADLDEEALKNTLLAFYGIAKENYQQTGIIESGPYRLEILNADRLAVIKREDVLLLLDGNVAIRFTQADVQGSKTLSASSIILDAGRAMLIGLDSVSLTDDRSETIESIQSSMIALYWQTGDLVMYDGMTTFERINSDKSTVNFFISGKKISFVQDRAVIGFQDGLITTSEKDAYASISARKLFFIEGGDMFLEHAVISIGRVPFLWVPFLFYPGQTFSFNPAFGFDSDRGMFFSTTTELYGKYPKIEKSSDSSFSTLLDASSNTETYRSGWVYKETEELSSLQTWAKESSSYLALLADAYIDGGLFFGIDTVNSFFKKSHKASLFGGIAIPGASAASSGAYNIPSFRYVVDGSYAIDTDYADVSLSIPFYSDPLVLKQYANRLTSFSIGALRGNQQFPDTYKNDIVSMNWLLNASLRVPTESIKPYLNTFTISQLSAKAVWKAKPKSEGPGYRLSSVDLPVLNMALGGTLLRFEHKQQSTQTEGKPTEVPIDTESSKVFHDYGIPDKFAAATSVSVAKAQSSSSSYINLSYSFTQNFSHQMNNPLQVGQDYSLYGKTQGTITLGASIAPDWLSLDSKLIPNITFDGDESGRNASVFLTSQNTVSIARFGLTYRLSSKLYDLRFSRTFDSQSTISETWGSWNAQDITVHSLTWSLPVSIATGVLTMSVGASLPPKTISLTPKLAFSMQNFNASFSQKFVNSPSQALNIDMSYFDVSYAYPDLFNFRLDATYDTGRFLDADIAFLDALSVKTSLNFMFFDKYLRLSNNLDMLGDGLYFKSLVHTISIPWLKISLMSRGPVQSIQMNTLDIDCRIENFIKRWWKDRIALKIEFLSSFHYSFIDDTATALRLSSNVGFEIAEFLAIELSVTTVNKGF